MIKNNYIIKWTDKTTNISYFDTIDAGMWPTKEWDIKDANDPDLCIVHYTYEEAVKALPKLEAANPKYTLQIKRCKIEE